MKCFSVPESSGVVARNRKPVTLSERSSTGMEIAPLCSFRGRFCVFWSILVGSETSTQQTNSQYTTGVALGWETHTGFSHFSFNFYIMAQILHFWGKFWSKLDVTRLVIYWWSAQEVHCVCSIVLRLSLYICTDYSWVWGVSAFMREIVQSDRERGSVVFHNAR